MEGFMSWLSGLGGGSSLAGLGAAPVPAQAPGANGLNPGVPPMPPPQNIGPVPGANAPMAPTPGAPAPQTDWAGISKGLNGLAANPMFAPPKQPAPAAPVAAPQQMSLTPQQMTMLRGMLQNRAR